MPAASTHVDFAKDVYDVLTVTSQLNISDLPLFYLGSQGPDLFFFSKWGALPGTLYKKGQAMHTQKVKETIRFMQNYVKEVPSLYSYYAGYLCHYALDKEAHPLINHFASICKTMPAGEAHIHYEADIDVYMLEKKHHPYNVFKSLQVSLASCQALATMYRHLFLEVFQWDIPLKTIAEAINHIPLLTKLLRPGNGMKYKFVYHIETLVKKRFVTAMMLDEKDGETCPVLNLQHFPWMNEDKKDTRSFDDVYQDALHKATILIEHFTENAMDKDFLGYTLC